MAREARVPREIQRGSEVRVLRVRNEGRTKKECARRGRLCENGMRFTRGACRKRGSVVVRARKWRGRPARRDMRDAARAASVALPALPVGVVRKSALRAGQVNRQHAPARGEPCRYASQRWRCQRPDVHITLCCVECQTAKEVG